MTRALRSHWKSAALRRQDAYRHSTMLTLVTIGFILVGKAVLWPLDAALALLPVSAPVSVDSFLIAGSAVLGVVNPSQDVPVTLVEIDDALYAQWGRPCVTPRDQLARLIGVVADQQPSAIVVDINLDCATATTCAAGGTCDLGAFFAAYRGPPLVLVRALYMDATRSGEPEVRVSRTSFDDAVATNPNILWANTMYLTDSDGTVRRWRDAWEACTDADTAAGTARPTETILGVPIRITALLRGDTSLEQTPPRSGQCSFSTQRSAEHLLILGPPIVGHTGFNTGSSAPRELSARLLLDSDQEIESTGYFSLAGRVVIIGATHAASGDVWRTPIGLMPGSELIAHTLRFARSQIDLPQRAAGYSKPITLIAFWTLAAFAFLLRPSLVVLVAGILSFIAIYLATGAFGRFDIFESLALSLWIFVEYAVAVAFWELFREMKLYRRWRRLRLLLSRRMRIEDAEMK
jgi:CHASE2 domain-containing sensor protein